MRDLKYNLCRPWVRNMLKFKRDPAMGYQAFLLARKDNEPRIYQKERDAFHGLPTVKIDRYLSLYVSPGGERAFYFNDTPFMTINYGEPEFSFHGHVHIDLAFLARAGTAIRHINRICEAMGINAKFRSKPQGMMQIDILDAEPPKGQYSKVIQSHMQRVGSPVTLDILPRSTNTFTPVQHNHHLSGLHSDKAIMRDVFTASQGGVARIGQFGAQYAREKRRASQRDA